MEYKNIILNNEVSNYVIYSNGIIINIKSNRQIKPFMNQFGYYQVILSHKGIRYIFQVHKLVAIYFLGKPKNDCYQVNHKDRNKSNNDIKNLEWVTSSENQLHAFKTDKHPRNHNRLSKKIEKKFTYY